MRGGAHPEVAISSDLPTQTLNKPIFYLPRHLATPSYETLYAIRLARKHSAALIIGQDVKSTFVAANDLKFPLAKLPFERGVDRHGKPIVSKHTIIDFNAAQGRPLAEIETHYGMSLADFHSKLLEPWLADDVMVVEESGWIDRLARDDVTLQYELMFSFCVSHAILLEWFSPSETDFARKVMVPSFQAVERRFGLRPLMVQLLPDDAEDQRNWHAYPPEVFEVFQDIVQNAARAER